MIRESSEKEDSLTDFSCCCGDRPRLGATAEVTSDRITIPEVAMVTKMTAATTNQASFPPIFEMEINPRFMFFFRAALVPRGDDNENDVVVITFLFLPTSSHLLIDMIN